MMKKLCIILNTSMLLNNNILVMSLSRAVVSWLLSQLNISLREIVLREHRAILFSPKLIDDIEEYLFRHLVLHYGIVGAYDFCYELESILKEELKDPERRKHLISYVRYLIDQFLRNYFRRRKKIAAEYSEDIVIYT